MVPGTGRRKRKDERERERGGTRMMGRHDVFVVKSNGTFYRERIYGW